MIRLSIQARQALARLTLPVLILASFALMLLGKADTLLAEKLRSSLADGLAPIYRAVADPLDDARTTWNNVADLWTMREDDARLRSENEQLRRWQSIALALDAENQRLKASLHWIPDPSASYVHGAGEQRTPADSMPRRCCCRSVRTTISAKARSPRTTAAWSGVSRR